MSKYENVIRNVPNVFHPLHFLHYAHSKNVIDAGILSPPKDVMDGGHFRPDGKSRPATYMPRREHMS